MITTADPYDFTSEERMISRCIPVQICEHYETKTFTGDSRFCEREKKKDYLSNIFIFRFLLLRVYRFMLKTGKINYAKRESYYFSDPADRYLFLF